MNSLKFKMLILFLFGGITSAFAQATIKSTCYNVDGYWGQWEDAHGWLNVTGTYSSFVIHQTHNHPSEYGCKINVYGYDDNLSKKEKKQRLKDGEWYTYNGSIEIFLKGNVNTARKWVKSFSWTLGSFDYKDAKGTTKATYAAKIMIAPYKKIPKTYNVIFEGCAIAFTLY